MDRRYRVIVTPGAADGIRQEHAWLRERNPRAADEWLTGMRKLIPDRAAHHLSRVIAHARLIGLYDVSHRPGLFAPSILNASRPV